MIDVVLLLKNSNCMKQPTRNPSDSIMKIASILSPAILMVIIFMLFPVAYQTNDDPNIALILEGDNNIGMKADAHSIFINYMVGWIVYSLSTHWPNTGWYGLLMASLYVVAYVFIFYNLIKRVSPSTLGWMVFILFIYLFAVAMVPLLLFQFTMLSGLLAIAGVLPLVRYICLKESCSIIELSIATLCLLVSVMIRYQMTIVIVMSCIPLLFLSVIYYRNWRNVVLSIIYLTFLVSTGLGVYLLDKHAYTSAPEYARFLEFNTIRAEYTDTEKHIINPSLYDEVGWSFNDYMMFSSFIGIDNGQFNLKNLQRIMNASIKTDKGNMDIGQKNELSGKNKKTHPKSSTLSKIKGMVQGKSLRHVLLTFYLVTVFASGLLLVAGGAILSRWKNVGFSSLIAFTSIVSCIIVSVVMDRAVFRVLFPCVYMFLIMAAIFFPWDKIKTFQIVTSLKKQISFLIVGGLFLFFLVDSMLGIIQIRENHNNQLFYDDMISRIKELSTNKLTIISWAGAFPIEYNSPFNKREVCGLDIYHIGWGVSHPVWLKHLKQRFGEDIYQGMLQHDNIQLIRYHNVVKLLESFTGEHYTKKVEGIKIESFNSREDERSAWFLADKDNQFFNN